MFIGHFALGLAAKKIAPKSNLGMNFMACQLLDLIWPALVLLGIETVQVLPGATEFTPLDFSHYPYSHSLLMTVVWSVLFGLAAGWFSRSRRVGMTLGLLVASHWVLDFVTHRPDLPLLFGDPKVGLGLWNSRVATVIIEGGLFALGLWAYLSVVTPWASKKAKWTFWSLIGLLLLAYGLNAFGPQPAPETPPAAIAGPALSMWLIVFWAGWADRFSIKVV